jgi:hypothetical protein
MVVLRILNNRKMVWMWPLEVFDVWYRYVPW